MCMIMPLIEEHINAMKDALEPLRPRSTARCASRGMMATLGAYSSLAYHDRLSDKEYPSRSQEVSFR